MLTSERMTETMQARTGNLLKTTALLAGLSALALGVGQAVAGGRGFMFGAVVVLVMNLLAFFFSDRLALAMNGARELESHELPWLHQLVAQVATKATLPAPKLYIVESPTPNAFATGRSPDKAAVAVTTGLLNMLNHRELTGVVAHELAHIRNRDTLIMTVAATLAGVITHVAHTVFFWGGSLLGQGSDDDEGTSGLGLLGVALVAPITATLLQLAISRSREFDADATAAEVTGDPRGLASALSRLEAGNEAMPRDVSPATAHLYIVNPLSGRGVMKLFATHPPLQERIDRLMALA